MSSPREHWEPRPLALADIRAALIRQEETIIFGMIERAHFKLNPCIYYANEDSVLKNSPALSKTEQNLGFMKFFLKQEEALQGRIGRYDVADEHSFFNPEELPVSVLKRTFSATPLKPNDVNLNEELLRVYVSDVLPKITSPGDDKHYGSSSLSDIALLQALSYRVHYGKYVAEAKFQENQSEFERLISAGNTNGIMDLLTHVDTEKRVIDRVKAKASRYGTDGDDQVYKVDPEAIAYVYEKYLIPLNKKVQVEYLMNRLDKRSKRARTSE